jgi:hypothetical protein
MSSSFHVGWGTGLAHPAEHLVAGERSVEPSRSELPTAIAVRMQQPAMSPRRATAF